MSYIWSGDGTGGGEDLVVYDEDLAQILQGGYVGAQHLVKHLGPQRAPMARPAHGHPVMHAPAQPHRQAPHRVIHVPEGSDRPVLQQPKQVFTKEMQGICPVNTTGVILAGATGTAVGTPQRPMFFKEFIISDSIAPSWLLLNIVIGATSMFNFQSPVSAEVWSSRSPRQASWTSQLITPGVQVQILVQNVGADAQFFSSFHGPSYE